MSLDLWLKKPPKARIKPAIPPPASWPNPLDEGSQWRQLPNTLAPYHRTRQAEARSPPAMPRPRYRQDPLPIGPDAPPVELFGSEQPNPPGLEVIQQGQLPVVPLGPLFEEQRADGEDSGEADLG